MVKLLNNLVLHVSQLLVLLAVAAGNGYLTKEYRFDYEFNENAGGWLKYHVVPMTWANARMQCHAEGAVLASPLTKQLKSAIVSFVKKQTILNYKPVADIVEPVIFSGVHATYSQGIYESVEGVPLLRMAITWFPGEPNNRKNLEHCLVMIVSANGTMADARCDHGLPYVCYKKDTMLGFTECGTTDHEYVLDKRTGSCYKLHRRPLIWSEAYKTCEAEGGYLAIINSDVEVKVIHDIESRVALNNNYSPSVECTGIGFSDWSYHHDFMTIHGDTLDEAGYQNWEKTKEPDNSSRVAIGDYGMHCGGRYENTNDIGAVLCQAPRSFLCEMNPDSLR